jgi:hypothetical protein
VDDLSFEFDPRSDVIDATVSPQEVTFSVLSVYRGIIWYTGSGLQSYLRTRIAPVSPGSERVNWLEVYQESFGNLLLVGPYATNQVVESEPWIYPLILNSSEFPPNGFGTVETWDGRIVNVGTRRWPYTGWCLETMDVVRPSLGHVYGENVGSPERTLDCDGLYRARVSESFIYEHPSAIRLPDLEPTTVRAAWTNGNIRRRGTKEEFYGRDVAGRPVIVMPRSCQVPMFVHTSRRDVGAIDDPSVECPPTETSRSVLDGATIGLQSSQYSDDKPRPGTYDYLWGFDLLEFQDDGVREALRWVMLDGWNLLVAKR